MAKEGNFSINFLNDFIEIFLFFNYLFLQYILSFCFSYSRDKIYICIKKKEISFIQLRSTV